MPVKRHPFVIKTHFDQPVLIDVSKVTLLLRIVFFGET